LDESTFDKQAVTPAAVGAPVLALITGAAA
jgi:hypothetical protein